MKNKLIIVLLIAALMSVLPFIAVSAASPGNAGNTAQTGNADNAGQEGGNLILNPGFEEVDGNSPHFWVSGSWAGKGIFSVEDGTGIGGSRCVCIVNETPDDSRFKQQIQVKPSTYYKLSCWMKAENAGQDNKGANLSIEGLLDTTRDIRGTSADWEYAELYGVTGSKQQTLIVTLGLGGYSSINTGKAWFDNVAVEELKEAPANVNVVNLFMPEQNRPPVDGQAKPGTWIWAVVALLVLLAGAAFIVKKSGKRTSTQSQSRIQTPTTIETDNDNQAVKLDRIDVLIMSAVTFIYAVVALVNLGSVKVPQTGWTPARPNESITVEFDKEIDISRIFYYCGLGHGRPDEGRYRIQYQKTDGSFEPLATLDKEDIFIWKTAATPDVNLKTLKIIVDKPGGTLNEIGFFEQGSTTPYTGFKITGKDVSSADAGDTGGGGSDGGKGGSVSNLFDEQDRIDYKHSYMSGMIFDEVYHARTAYEYLHGMQIYEWTHPPLGKLIISAGIAIFGMDPFGWRIAGTLLGIAMIPIMYLFGRKLFKKRFFAFCAAFLMSVDFMHFGLTRIATIDVFATFFIILMYYFMYDYYVTKSYTLDFRKSLVPLLLCGICFGLGAASKWISLYAGGGLALLFFMAKYREYSDYKVCVKKRAKYPWTNIFMKIYMYRTLLYCVLFFIVIPAAIYLASYIPDMTNPASGDGIAGMIRNQTAMYSYHSRDVLGSTHPFSSYWWEWPLMRRPLETYLGSDLPAGYSSTMTIMGNPAIWWAGIVAVFIAIYHAVKRRDSKMTVIFAAIAFQYLPWVGVTRIVFIYHFFSTVPFMILCIVYVAKIYMEKYRYARYFVYGFLAVAAILFVMFYPVLSGMEVRRDYVENFLLWFKQKWVF